jgi:hypothetical protein
MEKFWSRLRNQPLGMYLQVWIALALMVFGVFSYLSITACGEPSAGCGSPGGSSITYPPASVASPNGQAAIYQSTALKTPTGNVSTAPGAQVSRSIGWVGSQPVKLVWNPPSDSKGFIFSDPAKQPQPGGPPFVFTTPSDSIPIQFTMPTLPAGKTSMKVTETVEYTDALGSRFTSLVTLLQNVSGSSSDVLPRLPVSAPVDPKTLGATIDALKLERWIDSNGATMDTTLCQQVTDWLQSKATFVAMRVPVLAVAPDNPSFLLPVLFPADATKKPRLQLHGYQPPPVKNDVITPIPMELRPERMTFAENELPALSGEHWVTMGVAQIPKTTCPNGLNYTNWSYQISLPADLASKGEIPLYFCQEGQDPPPFAQAALQTFVQGTKGRKTLAVQTGGITCLGPQNHSLVTTSTAGNIQLDPAIAWNIQPPKEVRIRIGMQSNYSVFIGLNFSINSQIGNMTWTLYQGTYKEPTLSKPISSPYYTKGPEPIWLVGTVPAGTAPGPYNVTVSAVKADDPAVTGSATNIIWVGDWVPPPTALTGNALFVPSLQKQ